MFMDMGFFSMDLDMGPFGSSCVQLDDPEDYPSYAALWSCGLRVRGTSVCAPGEACCWTCSFCFRRKCSSKGESSRLLLAFHSPFSSCTAAGQYPYMCVCQLGGGI